MSDKKRPAYRMLTVQEIEALKRPLEWSPELVFHRLAEAVVVCSWVTQQPGPAQLRGGWPAVLRRWDNMLAETDKGEGLGRPHTRSRISPSKSELELPRQPAGSVSPCGAIMIALCIAAFLAAWLWVSHQFPER
jgi:hypothetical protein